MFTWHITSMAFSGGEVIPVEPGSVLLIIGPNSSGKSAALRNISAWLSQEYSPKEVVQQVAVRRGGDLKDFQAWFEESYPKRNLGGGIPHYVTRGGAVPPDQLVNYWNQGEMLPGLPQYLVTSLDTATRTVVANYTQAIDIWNNAPGAYVHQLQASQELHDRVNDEIRPAFGRELVIDWSAMPSIGFRVGVEPPRTIEHDRVSEEYARQLSSLMRLDDEGDGLKSFAGIVLATYCGSHPVVLIDEPEAFLHPPQARRLGAALARAAKESNRQVIVATHSADIVQGALNSEGRVAVCRLTREGNENHAAMLEAKQLQELWAKPLLRSAAAIDGLFHTGVVVCEADADVRLYEAAYRRIQSLGQGGATDLYFVQGGGKGELPTLAAAYDSLKTRTVVIADIDLLRNPVEHQKVLAALGSSLDNNDSRYKSMMQALADAPPLRAVGSAADELRAVAEEMEKGGEVGRALKERVSRALQESSTFSEAKRYGIFKLRGKPLQFARELLEEWRSVGLFLVPVGELESWWPDGPASDKAAWIAQVVDLLPHPETLPELGEFMGKVVTYFEQGGEEASVPGAGEATGVAQ